MMKQTEIGLIPDDWEVIKILGNYFLKGRIGWQGLKASEFKDQGPYLVTGTDFVNGRVNWNTCYHISEKRYEEDKALHVREDDILITKDGTIGKVAYVDKKPEKVSLNSHLLIIRPLKDKLLNRYLYYILNSKFFYDYYQQTQTGTTMASLSQDKISKFVYPLPSKEEQQRIAKALSDVDALISTTEKLLQKKKNIKQGTMQNLLTGKKRLPGFAKSTNYKQSELGPIPEDWEVKSLGEMVKIGHGRDYKNLKSGDVPVYGTGGYMTSVNDFLYEGETVCIGRKGTIDKPQYHSGKIWTVDTLFYTYDFKSLNPKYLFYKFCLIDWLSMNEASGVPSLTAKNIEDIQIALPPEEEQTAIASVLSSMDKEIETLNTKLEKYRNLKTAMMQQLLTGKIRLVK